MLDRFLHYISFDTRADEESETKPSSPGQLVLGKELVKELEELGLEAAQDTLGFVYGTLPSNVSHETKTVGFIAHMDTATEMDGKVLHPQIFTYTGGDIYLGDSLVMRESEFPDLKKVQGKTLITTDGTTLLGADNKAGIAIIMEMLKEIIEKDLPHGTIKIAFTPDEEIGTGIGGFDIEGFGADFAYTLDGGPLGFIEYENFNAASCNITAKGNSIHPGAAKDKLINALNLIFEFYSMLPPVERPEHTEGREGFYMLRQVEGNQEEAKASYLIRDHDEDLFENKKKTLQDIADYLNKKYGERITLTITDSYQNMRSIIEENYFLIEMAEEAIRELGIEPIYYPMRGGTDGAVLTRRGLPCPNLFTGGYYFHGPYELIPLEDMIAAKKVLISIIGKITEKDL